MQRRTCVQGTEIQQNLHKLLPLEIQTTLAQNIASIYVNKKKSAKLFSSAKALKQELWAPPGDCRLKSITVQPTMLQPCSRGCRQKGSPRTSDGLFPGFAHKEDRTSGVAVCLVHFVFYIFVFLEENFQYLKY